MRRSTPRRTTILAVWCAFAFVTWNVVFDDFMNQAAFDFTQEQILRHQRGERVASIDEAFRPRLREAAAAASAWAAGILLAGGVVTHLVGKPSRHRKP